MAQKRKYQVFISSTYTDLRKERQAAVEAVLLAGHIPAGMELFSAGDEEQLKVIKRWIDESDIYCLILGSRYGSIEPSSGNSYIEVEYDYAVARGKPLFALVLSDEAVQQKNAVLGDQHRADQDQDQFAQFRQKVLSKITRMVDDDKDIKIYTAEAIRGLEDRHELDGWIRSTEAPDIQPLVQSIASVTEERDSLRDEVARLSRQVPNVEKPGTLAGLQDEVRIAVTYKYESFGTDYTESVTVTWGQLFAMISPLLLENPSDKLVQLRLGKELLDFAGKKGFKSAEVVQGDHDTVKIHLVALGLITTTYNQTISGSMALFWSLSESGRKALLELRSVRKGHSSEDK